MTSAANDPATPRPEQANVYATLTELNHFSDPSIPFAAQYGADGQRIVDQGNPFSTIYLLPLVHRTPEALDDTVSHLGSYLFHELTTPLGIRLDLVRRTSGRRQYRASGALTTPFRSFGTYAVWFPRGLLLRAAARKACMRLIDGWLGHPERDLDADIQIQIAALCKETLSHPDYRPELLHQRIEKGARVPNHADVEVTPGEALAGVLARHGRPLAAGGGRRGSR